MNAGAGEPLRPGRHAWPHDPRRTSGQDHLGLADSAGVVNSLGGSSAREAAFWLLYLGVPFVLIGIVTGWAQRRTGTVPASLGWATLISGVICAAVVPASGAWLLIALGLYTVAVARRDSRAGHDQPHVPAAQRR